MGSAHEISDGMDWRRTIEDCTLTESWEPINPALNVVALRKPRGSIAFHGTDNPDERFGRSTDLRRGDVHISQTR